MLREPNGPRRITAIRTACKADQKLDEKNGNRQFAVREQAQEPIRRGGDPVLEFCCERWSATGNCHGWRDGGVEQRAQRGVSPKPLSDSARTGLRNEPGGWEYRNKRDPPRHCAPVG
jgi:hypothetical protein